MLLFCRTTMVEWHLIQWNIEACFELIDVLGNMQYRHYKIVEDLCKSQHFLPNILFVNRVEIDVYKWHVALVLGNWILVSFICCIIVIKPTSEFHGALILYRLFNLPKDVSKMLKLIILAILWWCFRGKLELDFYCI